jgi:hypothetical protein
MLHSWGQCYKTFLFVINYSNKLECLSRASLLSLVLCLWVRLEATLVKRISGASLYGRFLALFGWKGLPGTNALAYYERS